jgi:hypothetical protein
MKNLFQKIKDIFIRKSFNPLKNPQKQDESKPENLDIVSKLRIQYEKNKIIL